MKKYLVFVTIVMISLSISAQEDGEFSYNPETKSVQPRYLGKVFLLKGSVSTVSSNGKSNPLTNDSKVLPGDKIITAKRSMVKIEMIDTTVITIAPSSEFEFTKWDYKTKEDRKAVFTLLKGRMRSNIKVKNKESGALKYQVGTVSMGIRGTRILANAYQRNDRVRVAHVVVLSGETEIYDSATDKNLELNGGQQYISFLKPDGTILRQEGSKLSPLELKKLKATDKNPRKYFKPFLPKISSKGLTHGSRNSDDMGSKNAKNHQRGQKKNKSWRSTLDQLNNRLNSEDDE